MTVISGISVFDADSANLTVELSASHGKMSVPPSGIVTGNGTHTVTLVGEQADINTALAVLNYEFDVGYLGNDEILITAFDGSLQDTRTVTVISTEAGAFSGAIAFSFATSANLAVLTGDLSSLIAIAFSLSANLTTGSGAGDWTDDAGETAWVDDTGETTWVDD